jgi:hypothetical protein
LLKKKVEFPSMNAVKAGAAVFLLVMIAMNSPARGQDTTASKSKLDRIEYVGASGLTFSILDYVGFSLVRKGNNQAPVWYRLLEGTVQTAISYLLYKECGLSSAISFNLIWWTWGLDFGWYGWANLLNPSTNFANGRWENRSWNGLQGREISWAGWTPIGLLRPRGSLIARDALIWQSILGFAISITIL